MRSLVTRESIGAVDRINTRCLRHGSWVLTHNSSRLRCYDMEVGENRVRVFYGTEKRERERLEIYTGGISPCSRDRVSDL